MIWYDVMCAISIVVLKLIWHCSTDWSRGMFYEKCWSSSEARRCLKSEIYLLVKLYFNSTIWDMNSWELTLHRVWSSANLINIFVWLSQNNDHDISWFRARVGLRQRLLELVSRGWMMWWWVMSQFPSSSLSHPLVLDYFPETRVESQQSEW